MEASVNDLHPGITQSGGHDLGATVVAIEARLRD
jgi:hypothetical protein